jgi:hypothetical protein
MDLENIEKSFVNHFEYWIYQEQVLSNLGEILQPRQQHHQN